MKSKGSGVEVIQVEEGYKCCAIMFSTVFFSEAI